MTSPQDRDTLVTATLGLTDRVSTLIDVVTTNNLVIGELRREINRKPDDTELEWVALEAKRQRIRTTRQLLLALAITAIVSGAISYGASIGITHKQNQQRLVVSNEACIRSNSRTQILMKASIDAGRPDIASQLGSTLGNCNALYPIK